MSGSSFALSGDGGDVFSCDDDDDDSDREVFLAYLLRFRFQDHAFLGLWSALKEVGWTHDSGTRTYRSPYGRVFDGALDVVQYLDHPSISDARSNLEVPADDDDDNDDLEADEDLRLPSHGGNGSRSAKVVWTDEEQELAWTLRTHAVMELWKRAAAKARSTSARDGSDDDDQDDSVSSDDEKGPSRTTTRRSPCLSIENRDATIASARRAAAASLQSETVTEKGTALYLAKNSRRVRFQKSKSAAAAAAAAEDADSIEVTLAQLVEPSVEACQRRMREASERHRDAKAVDPFRERFADWRWLLSTNHSLLFYGAGSKRDLLNAFADEELSKEGCVLVLDGCDKDITIEAILALIVRMFVGESKRGGLPSRSRAPHMDGIEGVTATGTYTPWKAEPVVERAIQVGRALADRCGEALTPLFLVVHTLEGLGNRVAQEALSNLLVNSVVANGVAAVRLVASIDHVDAPLLWSTTTKANYSFLYQLVHTHQPYAEEVRVLPSKKKRAASSASSRKKAVQTVTPRKDIASTEFLKLLAPRIVEVVQILARLQLDAHANQANGVGEGSDSGKGKRKGSAGDPEPIRIPFRTLAKECKRACAINKESQLKTYLAEVHDHGLVIYEDDMVCIPQGPDKLKELMAVSHRAKG